MATLNKSIFEAALQGLIAQRDIIDSQISEVRQYLDGNSTSTRTTTETPEEGTPGKRKFSAASRRKMAEAQKRRWAGIKGESVTAEAVSPVKKKRRMSAAGRKAIAEATRKRWAEFRAAKK